MPGTNIIVLVASLMRGYSLEVVQAGGDGEPEATYYVAVFPGWALCPATNLLTPPSSLVLHLTWKTWLPQAPQSLHPPSSKFQFFGFTALCQLFLEHRHTASNPHSDFGSGFLSLHSRAALSKLSGLFECRYEPPPVCFSPFQWLVLL